MFKEIGRADELGSGVRNLYSYYQLYSDKTPVLEEQDVFKCIIYIHVKPYSEQNDTLNDTINDTLNDTLKSQEKRIQNIIRMIRTYPQITQNQLADKLKVSVETIKRDLNKMQKSKSLKRKGSRKSGYWELLK